MSTIKIARVGLAAALIGVLGGATCDQPELTLPSESEARGFYGSSSDISVRLSGNVLEVLVNQPYQQVRRGGALWAKVGPYIYLFTEETEAVLNTYPGLAGVRVITRTSRRDTEVARAFLLRDRLNDITWRRAKNVAGRARLEGTERPSYLEDLVEWGEDRTEFSYSAEFVNR